MECRKAPVSEWLHSFEVKEHLADRKYRLKKLGQSGVNHIDDLVLDTFIIINICVIQRR
jgi:hypothetical protein